MSASQPVSNWWYLLPIIFGIIGGIIAWFRFRKTHPNKARMFIIVGLVLTLVLGVAGDYLVDPWFEEFEQVNQWCAAEFDKLFFEDGDINSTVMIENYCFTYFEDWKHSSQAYTDGTAEKYLNSIDTSIQEIVQHNVLRESELP